MAARTVEEIEGPWRDPIFDTGLIRRCRVYWSVPVDQLPNDALATNLRQRIALEVIVPEAKRQIDSGFDDDMGLYDGELAEALNGIVDA